MINLTEQQLERYSRHILLKDVGVEGQERIMKSRILIIGAGGLGAPAALYLAAAGVGVLGIVDSDSVELSNLQRQIIHFTTDLKKSKVLSAAEKIKLLNPDVLVDLYNERVTATNIRQIIRSYDFVIDGTDNFAAKFLINDACVMEKIPFSHGGILRFTGQTMTVVPGQSACYRCVFSAPPPKNAVPSCSQAGVLGAIAGMLGTIQAAEALKFVAKIGKLLENSLLTFDALKMDFRKITLHKRSDCPVCGENPYITELHDEEQPVCDLKKESNKMTVITKKVAEKIVEHARACAPIEACGYLAGDNHVISEHIPLTNADSSTEHFSLVPAEQFEAVRTIRSKGLKLLAVYHSHPVTPARPSEEDIRLAFDPDLSYVIVSLAQIEPSIRSFRIRDGKAEEELVIIGEGGPL